MTSLKNCPVNTQRGEYVRKDIIEPVGTCDYSGFLFSKSDLVKQYDWRGNELVWTGAIVGRPYVDEPNETNRPPQIKGDPKAVLNPRPFGIETPIGPNASGNYSPTVLDNINFNTEQKVGIVPTFAGQDVSKMTTEERLRLLHQIP
ncbi:MAG: hypothetical protein ACRCX2_37260 [Paraclostridium sp.]